MGERDDDDSVSALVFHLTRDMRNALERRMASHGITAQQATLARLLRGWERKKKSGWPARPERPARQLEIAARLGTDGAGMTRLIDRLEAKGVVIRRPMAGDRRFITIELTETGKAIAGRAAPQLEQLNRQLLAGFTETEVEQLTSLLKRLRENARKMQA